MKLGILESNTFRALNILVMNRTASSLVIPTFYYMVQSPEFFPITVDTTMKMESPPPPITKWN